MANRHLQDLSVIRVDATTAAAEARLSNAVVLLDVQPPNPPIADIHRAIQQSFGDKAVPLAITPFRSDFIVQFATVDERNEVVLSEILYGENFSALLVCWSNHYGGQAIDWNTELAIDIHGFPPHTFHPNALAQLLDRHCSIQDHVYSQATGDCRVGAFAANANSIPRTGHVGLQYPTQHGVRNIVFPVTMTAYNYSEAPPFPMNQGYTNKTECTSNDPALSLDSAAEAGCDREMYDEAMEWQMRANARIERGKYRGFATYSQSSVHSDSSDDGFYITHPDARRRHAHESDSPTSAFTDDSDETFRLPRDYSSGWSMQSDRTRHLN